MKVFTHLVYIDDSQDGGLSVFSALAIPAREWQVSFDRIKSFRQEFQRTHGISIYSEFHAWKFVSGRGNLGGSEIVRGGWEVHRRFKSQPTKLHKREYVSPVLP